MHSHKKNIFRALPIFLIISRLMLILTLPLEGLRGFGDFIHFYRLAGMGIPFVDYWVEFPPIFPFFSRLIYSIAGGRQHTYDYLLIFVLTLAQAISLTLFIRIAEKLYGETQAIGRILVYFAILVCLSYGWWYFDPLAELAFMAALAFLLDGKDVRSGIMIGMGVLTKLFPILLVPLVWRMRPIKKAAAITIIGISIVVVVYGALFTVAPEMSKASAISQASKGSWETVWALLDRNFGTGNFGMENERFVPATASLPRGNLPEISPWLTLLPFLGLGGWIFWKAQLNSKRAAIAFLGITWCIFFIWSPGWSPQWIIYLIPLILLSVPERQAFLLSLALVFVNLLEWPVLLSRGYNIGLWFTIPTRTFLFVLVIIVWLGMLFPSRERELSYAGD
ncbi:MAG: hypothetical protein P8Z00_24385 [Anaerolineales bacterium]|jgi:hypothetical protein